MAALPTDARRMVCVIAEPIHPAGIDYLRERGIDARLAPDPVLERTPGLLRDADAIVVRGALSAAAIDAAPRLKIIANHGTGTDAVDVAHATRRGIPVSCTPETNVASVAEHALMLMLAVARQTTRADAATRAADARFRYEEPLLSLCGKTLGIAGFGRTGRLVAQLGAAIGMHVAVWSPSSPSGEIERAGHARVLALHELLAQADVVSLHRPLRADTARMLDGTALAAMKPTAIVVNTSRGGLIDEAALADAIRSGRLHGAGLDVLADEPMPATSPLAQLDRVVLTPHVAGSTQEALRQTALQCAADVVDALAGSRPRDLANPQVWADGAPCRPVRGPEPTH
ncbi:hydroxyacid dehydrogenase [Burkholderia multivorans]|uniref:hydroxyacid dehydrogenase n=1 Tax=Burkholderia multivorans TaxID=87883 RepID=UPI0020B3D0A6|nr:hydroxyacid dehydrogenase [Burkholderia multivorans]